MTPAKAHRKKPGLVVLFGSGELTSVGRSIREEVFTRAGLTAPVVMGILETPTGFEVNAIHGWPERQQEFFEKHLANYHPKVTRIRAWRKDGQRSTNDPALVDALLTQDYIYSGAGSPTYVIRHLRGTRAWRNIVKAHKQGAVLCFGSATAVAVGAYAIPVYEIFKAGADLSWARGLNFFKTYGLSIAVVPHWNNQEGEDFDSTRCWMGVDRFDALQSLLPQGITVLGIEETTAVVFDFTLLTMSVLGTGNVHILRGKDERTLKSGETHPVSVLKYASAFR